MTAETLVGKMVKLLAKTMVDTTVVDLVAMRDEVLVDSWVE